MRPEAPWRGRAFEAAAVVALLVVGLVVRLDAARHDSPTYDEAYHLASGYLALRGDLRHGPEAPPLARMLLAAPLLSLPLEPPLLPDHGAPPLSAIAIAADHTCAARFVYGNTRPPEEIIARGRAVTVTLSLLLAAALWLLTRRSGPLPGLVALAFGALEPTLVAHGHLATIDVAVTLFSLFAVEAWRQGVRAPTGGGRHELSWAAVAGAAVGCAVASKLSGLVTLPALVVLGLAAHGRAGLPRLVRALAVAALSAALVLLLVHRFQVSAYVEHLQVAIGYAGTAQGGYFMGRPTRPFEPAYFPVALAIKSSTALVGLLVASLALLVVRRRTARELEDLVLPACTFSLALTATLHIGVRHVLPALPHLIMFAARLLERPRACPTAAARGWRAVATTLVLGALALEVGARHPRHIAFFNLLIGGPARGARFLVDSNLDWGQEYRALAEEVRRLGLRGVILAPYVVGDPGRYGLAFQRAFGVGSTPEGDLVLRPGDRVVLACSVNLIVGHSARPDEYAWLRGRRPIAVVGHAIELHEVTGDAVAMRHVARSLAAHGRPDRAAALLALLAASPR